MRWVRGLAVAVFGGLLGAAEAVERSMGVMLDASVCATVSTVVVGIVDREESRPRNSEAATSGETAKTTRSKRSVAVLPSAAE